MTCLTKSAAWASVNLLGSAVGAPNFDASTVSACVRPNAVATLHHFVGRHHMIWFVTTIVIDLATLFTGSAD